MKGARLLGSEVMDSERAPDMLVRQHTELPVMMVQGHVAMLKSRFLMVLSKGRGDMRK